LGHSWSYFTKEKKKCALFHQQNKNEPMILLYKTQKRERESV
jgi:hypothetical protein